MISSISSSIANIASITLPTPTITSDQSSVQQATAASSAQRVGGRHHHHHGTPPAMDAAAQALGVTDSDLQQSLQSGTSLADLATQKGVSTTDLVSAIAQGMQANAPANAPANVDYTTIAQNIVDRKGPPAPPDPSSGAGSSAASSPGTDAFGQVSSILGMSQSDLLSSLESGTSFTDLLTQKGLTVQALTSELGTTQGLAIDTTA